MNARAQTAMKQNELVEISVPKMGGSLHRDPYSDRNFEIKPLL